MCTQIGVIRPTESKQGDLTFRLIGIQLASVIASNGFKYGDLTYKATVDTACSY